MAYYLSMGIPISFIKRSDKLINQLQIPRMSDTETKETMVKEDESLDEKKHEQPETRKTVLTGDSPIEPGPILTEIQPLIELASHNKDSTVKQDIIDISDLHSSSAVTLTYSEIITDNQNKKGKSHIIDFLLRAIFAIITALMILLFFFCIMGMLVEVNKPRSKDSGRI